MPGSFDAYHELLGIPPEDQPPNHYRLLGVRAFESNKDVIANAAARQMKYLRSLGGSDYADEAQRLLNEVAAAKLCLWNDEKRARYDAQMRSFAKNAVPDRQISSQSTEFSSNLDCQAVTDGGPEKLEQQPPYAAPKSPDQLAPPTANQSEPPPRPSNPPANACDSKNAKTTLPTRTWVVGSSPDCDIVVDSDVVSRRHCQLIATTEGFFLEDLGSTNGTYVNRSRIVERVIVVPRDRITLGKSTAMPWPANARK